MTSHLTKRWPKTSKRKWANLNIYKDSTTKTRESRAYLFTPKTEYIFESNNWFLSTRISDIPETKCCFNFWGPVTVRFWGSGNYRIIGRINHDQSIFTWLVDLTLKKSWTFRKILEFVLKNGGWSHLGSHQWVEWGTAVLRQASMDGTYRLAIQHSYWQWP